MSGTYLITGGTGNTALKLVSRLHAAGFKTLLASRKGTDVPAPYTGVLFDWNDSATYSKVFEGVSDVRGVYLVAPTGFANADAFKEFIEVSRKNGVNRFVALASSINNAFYEKLNAHIKALGKEGVEYSILRPTWFFENFTRSRAAGIANSDSFISATGEGKIGLISSDDIADIAFRALTDETAPHSDPLIVGPELLSYDEVADILSDVLGRRITHNKISVPEYITLLEESRGLPRVHAEFLANVEGDLGKGSEEKLIAASTDNIIKGTTTIREFFEKNKATWSKAAP